MGSPLRVDPRLREAAEDSGKKWAYEQPAWVFTTRKLPAVPGADIRFVQGDVRPVHAEMVAAMGTGTSGWWAAASWWGSSTTRVLDE